jgi:hypothetical protein
MMRHAVRTDECLGVRAPRGSAGPGRVHAVVRLTPGVGGDAALRAIDARLLRSYRALLVARFFVPSSITRCVWPSARHPCALRVVAKMSERACQGSTLLLILTSMAKRKPKAPHLNWNEAVLKALRSSKDTVHLSYLNGYVKKRFAYLLKHNHTWTATIRRVVQVLRDRGSPRTPAPGTGRRSGQRLPWASPHKEDT